MSNTQTARPAEYGLVCSFLCTFSNYLDPFLDTTHSTLQIYDHAGSTQPTPFPILLRVYNANDGTSIPFALKSVDTIGKLQRCYQKMRPELVGRLNLAYNGKPVPALKTLGELGVKPGATFITYQKVTGG
uniref:Ubiquitin-like domain-containing protein n=1 Tax=Electrophorus electricus TaxID=8005 RepID=A0A4W4E3G6_ELEEL